MLNVTTANLTVVERDIWFFSVS